MTASPGSSPGADTTSLEGPAGRQVGPEGHPVVTVLRSRYGGAGGAPGSRSDGHRVALVVEGGGGRGAFSAGMALAIEELGLLDCFDDVYGASAGALNGAWLLSRGVARGVPLWWDDAVIRRVTNFLSPLRGRPVVDNRYLIETACGQLVPMDFDAVVTSPVRFHPLATDADTGESVDLAALVQDAETLRRALCATTCMPLLSGPPVRLGGSRYLDAGVSQPVPVHTAIADGATHVVVLRTRTPGDVPQPISPLQRRFMRRHLARKAPGTVDVWCGRYERECADERFFDRHAANPSASPSVLEIRPPTAADGLLRNDRDPAQLKSAVEVGRMSASGALRSAADQVA